MADQNSIAIKKPEVYFGASDRQMESYIDEKSFKEAIVYGILLHGDLVIIDIFFYISIYLEKMILDEKFSSDFIIEALHNGAIIPDFRSKNTQYFKDNFNEIKKSGIQGMRDRAAAIAAALDTGISTRKLFAKTWPNDPVSVGYKATIERLLLTDAILDRFPEMEPLWNELKPVREGAIATVTTDSLGGFRRGDIYNAVFKHFNKTDYRIEDVRHIWANLPGRRDTELARQIIKWVNYCYYYNQGNMFQLSPGFSALSNDDVNFTKVLNRFTDVGALIEPISEEFRIPSPDALLTVDPRRLFELRNSSVGHAYFAALVRWQTEPTLEGAEVLKDALRAYVAAMILLFRKNGANLANWEWYLNAHIPPGKGPWYQNVQNSLLFGAKLAAKAIIQNIGVSSIIGNGAAAVYELIPAEYRAKIGPIGPAGTKVKIDIEKETQRILAADNSLAEASFVKLPGVRPPS